MFKFYICFNALKEVRQLAFRQNQQIQNATLLKRFRDWMYRKLILSINDCDTGGTSGVNGC